jgi:hypothetical protein
MALTVEPGLNDLRTEPMELHRTAIQPRDNMLTFAHRIRFGKLPTEALRHRLRALIERRHVSVLQRRGRQPLELIREAYSGKLRSGR